MCIDSFNDARLKLRQAEDTSALETDIEDSVKSRIKRKKLLTDVEDSDDGKVYPSNNKNKKKYGALAKLPALPSSLQLTTGNESSTFIANCFYSVFLTADWL